MIQTDSDVLRLSHAPKKELNRRIGLSVLLHLRSLRISVVKKSSPQETPRPRGTNAPCIDRGAASCAE